MELSGWVLADRKTQNYDHMLYGSGCGGGGGLIAYICICSVLFFSFSSIQFNSNASVHRYILTCFTYLHTLSRNSSIGETGANKYNFVNTATAAAAVITIATEINDKYTKSSNECIGYVCHLNALTEKTNKWTNLSEEKTISNWRNKRTQAHILSSSWLWQFLLCLFLSSL